MYGRYWGILNFSYSKKKCSSYVNNRKNKSDFAIPNPKKKISHRVRLEKLGLTGLLERRVT